MTSTSPVLEQITVANIGEADITLPAMICYARGGAKLDVELPFPTLAAVGNRGNAGVLDVTLPMMTLEATGWPDHTGTVDVDLPFPTLYARGRAGGRFDDYVLRHSRGL